MSTVSSKKRPMMTMNSEKLDRTHCGTGESWHGGGRADGVTVRHVGGHTRARQAPAERRTAHVTTTGLAPAI